jgi:hypothetical protein
MCSNNSNSNGSSEWNKKCVTASSSKSLRNPRGPVFYDPENRLGVLLQCHGSTWPTVRCLGVTMKILMMMMMMCTWSSCQQITEN